MIAVISALWFVGFSSEGMLRVHVETIMYIRSLVLINILAQYLATQPFGATSIWVIGLKWQKEWLPEFQNIGPEFPDLRQL